MDKWTFATIALIVAVSGITLIAGMNINEDKSDEPVSCNYDYIINGNDTITINFKEDCSDSEKELYLNRYYDKLAKIKNLTSSGEPDIWR